MSEPLFQPRNDFQARLLGAGAVAAGIALLYWQIQGTIERANEGQENILVSLSLIGFGEMFLALGTYWIIKGLAGYAHVRVLQKDPAAKKKFMIIGFVAIGATWFALAKVLEGLGYTT